MRGAATLPERDAKSIVDAYILGGERTPAQDIRYQFQQLTDVIIRALSPAINDPFTAVNGIDQIASGIAEFARRDRVAVERQDSSGALRLIISAPQLIDLLGTRWGISRSMPQRIDL